MIILCTHPKGGVGRTTLAVNTAGALISQLDKTLLIDCDAQADSWRFCTGTNPQAENKLRRIGPKLSIIWNPERRAILRRTLAEYAKIYMHTVLDIDNAMENTVQTILQSHPDIVLVPINKSQQDLALVHLSTTLSMIAQLESKLNNSPQVIVVPLGVNQDRISATLERARRLPRNYRIAPEVRDLQEQASRALVERKYIWEYSGCEDLLNYFRSLLVRP